MLTLTENFLIHQNYAFSLSNKNNDFAHELSFFGGGGVVLMLLYQHLKVMRSTSILRFQYFGAILFQIAVHSYTF